MPLRQTIAALMYSSLNLFVDGYMQVAAASLNKKALVLWIGTQPTLFGYSKNQNIKADFSVKMKKYIDTHPAHLASGNSNEFNTLSIELVTAFTADEIVKKLNKSHE